MENMINIINVISSIFTIIASGIAIYLFIFKQKPIKSIFYLLLNYSYHLTQNELINKLESLNTLNANDQKQTEEVINIFNDIEGQIRGNNLLKDNCSEILKKITRLNNSKEISEPKKRSLVSELRENLRNIDFKNFEEIYTRKQ